MLFDDIQNTQIAFTDLKLRGNQKDHGSCTFLGYADATLRVLVAGAEVLSLRIRNIELKVLNGRFRVDFPSEKGSDGKWYPMIFPKSADSRKELTDAMLAACGHVEPQRFADVA